MRCVALWCGVLFCVIFINVQRVGAAAARVDTVTDAANLVAQTGSRESQPGVLAATDSTTRYAGARGRVRIANNVVVAEDGVLLRGGHVALPAGSTQYANFNDDPNSWTRIRDNYNLNLVRLICYRLPIPNWKGQAFTVDEIIPHIDKAVDNAEAAGIYIIVDYHPVSGYDVNDARDFWTKVAPRYKDRTHVLYEVTNEPFAWYPDTYARDQSALVSYEGGMYQLVRSLAPATHIILWSLSNIASSTPGAVAALVDKGSGILYDNASVGFHPYQWDAGAQDQLTRLRQKYPVINTEFESELFFSSPPATIQQMEALGISWVWLGDKLFAGGSSPAPWPQPFWPRDPGTTLNVPATPPPAIHNISAVAVAASAVITWATDAGSTSRADYGATTAYGAAVSDLSITANHSLSLTGLTCATAYQYTVTSANAAGVSASSSNQSFTTASCPTAGAPVSDNFDATSLNAGLWTFVNPVGDGTLTFNGFEAQLTVPHGSDHDSWTSGNRSVRILQTIPNADFEVVARFNSLPAVGFQTQGLMVEQDSSNYIRFDSYHNGTELRLFCASFANGTPTVLLGTPVVSQSFGPPLWLRMKRTGDTWTGSYSTDGANYTFGVTFQRSLIAARIGPFAGNGGIDTPAFTASVDYFFNAAIPAANKNGPLPFDRFVIDPNPPTTTLLKTFADIDGDGLLDAVVGFGNPPGSSQGQGIWWYRFPHSGDPASHWDMFPILRSGLMYDDSVAYDVNHDGAIDVVASFSGGQISWFENPRGHGGNPATDTWTQHLIGPGSGTNSMVLADIDGDGKTDLVTNGFLFFQDSPDSWVPVRYNKSSNGAALLDIGSGNGPINLIGFGDVAPFPFVWLENPREHGGNPRSDPWIVHVIGSGYNDTGSASAYAAADLNGDGRMDVVTGQAGGGNPVPMGALWWWEAPADRRSGVWIKHVIDPTYSASQKINVADMDGNGTTDIVTAEQEQAPQRRVSIFYNDGRGNFSQTVLSNGSGHNVTLGDAEADGDLDILSSAHGYFGAPHPVELYRNRKTRR